MKKHKQKVVSGIILFMMFTLAAISTCRAAAASQNLTESKDVKVTTAPEQVGWTDWEDIYFNGGVKIKFVGQDLLVKAGFIRGVYDSYTKTYKAEPVVFLQTESIITSYLRSGQSEHYNLGTGSVTAAFTEESVKISNYAKASEQVTISYSDLLAKWVTYASTHCAKHLDKRYCLVPQILRNGSYKQYGWVATENTPLYYTTSMPQDYVDLYKQVPPNNVTQYRPIVYSLPLRLAFVLSTSQPNIWEIRQMTAEEIGEAMLEE